SRMTSSNKSMVIRRSLSLLQGLSCRVRRARPGVNLAKVRRRKRNRPAPCLCGRGGRANRGQVSENGPPLLLAAGPDGVGVLGSGGRGGAIAVSRSRAVHGVGVFLAPVALIVIGCGLVNEV